ncbi:unnamed protein product, partial [Didymodactylos carnosus]
TPLPASPPPSHRHFAPSVASSPAILKLPVPLVPTNLSPPRGITESTITLAPITALPPRTTGNIQPAVTSNAMTSAPKHPATKAKRPDFKTAPRPISTRTQTSAATYHHHHHLSHSDDPNTRMEKAGSQDTRGTRYRPRQPLPNSEPDRQPAAVPQPATTSGSANTTTAHNSKPQGNQTLRATKQHLAKCRPATHESKQTQHHVTPAPTTEHGNNTNH